MSQARDADQLGGLGPVAEIVAAPVEEQIHGGAVDELEALLRHALPVVSRNALATDAAGDREELQIEIFNAELVDLFPDLLDQFLAARRLDEQLDVHGPRASGLFSCFRFDAVLHGTLPLTTAKR